MREDEEVILKTRRKPSPDFMYSSLDDVLDLMTFYARIVDSEGLIDLTAWQLGGLCVSEERMTV